MRTAAVAAICIAALLPLRPGAAETAENAVIEARYVLPTTRYAHGVLGDAVEWGGMELVLSTCADCDRTRTRKVRITLPPTRVFEDTVPRVVHLPDGSGTLVVVVESHLDQGARLAIYDADGFVTATPYIGQRNRWLAPVGAADLNGDGVLEIAYVDRPHLARTLRVWRYRQGSLTEVASLPGLTNHRIGERDIAGGIRDCPGAPDAPEMIVADADWQRIVAVRLQGDRLTARDIGPHRGRADFAAAMGC